MREQRRDDTPNSGAGRVGRGGCRRWFGVVTALLALNVAFQPSANAQKVEQPDDLISASVLSSDLLRSGSHKVGERASITDNLLTFDVESDFGFDKVTSIALLETRVFEYRVLSEAIEQYAGLNDKMAGRLRQSFQFPAGNDVRTLSTTQNESINDIATQLSENDQILSARSVRKRSSRTVAPLPPGQGPIYESHRRNVASHLGLDPYSTNRQVQRFLATVANARAHGEFSAGTGLVLTAQKPAIVRVASGRVDGEISSLVRHLDAAELRAGLDGELKRAGVSDRVRRGFLSNPFYTLTLQASLAAHVDFLGAVEGRDSVFAAAVGARNEAEAISFGQFARMLAVYHEQVGPISQLLSGGGALPAALRADGTLVLMLPVDYVFWTPAAARTFDSLRSSAPSKGGQRPIELVVRGTLSPLARRELGARRVVIRESFLTPL